MSADWTSCSSLASHNVLCWNKWSPAPRKLKQPDDLINCVCCSFLLLLLILILCGHRPPGRVRGAPRKTPTKTLSNYYCRIEDIRRRPWVLVWRFCCGRCGTGVGIFRIHADVGQHRGVQQTLRRLFNSTRNKLVTISFRSIEHVTDQHDENAQINKARFPGRILFGRIPTRVSLIKSCCH